MNKVKKFLASATFLFIPSAGVAWHGNQVEIKAHLKNNKSVSVMVRYYTQEELSKRQLDLKGFGWGNRFVKINIGRPKLLVSTDLSHMPTVTTKGIYENYKRALNLKGDLCDIQSGTYLHFPGYENYDIEFPKVIFNYNESGLIVIAHEEQEKEGQKILDLYKAAMKKIVQEESGVTYKETRYKNGNVVEQTSSCVLWSSESLWSKFKNFVWNEKFLYAMAGVSALYLGYEYLNQK
jgi:hypothetical protein